MLAVDPGRERCLPLLGLRMLLRGDEIPWSDDSTRTTGSDETVEAGEAERRIEIGSGGGNREEDGSTSGVEAGDADLVGPLMEDALPENSLDVFFLSVFARLVLRVGEAGLGISTDATELRWPGGVLRISSSSNSRSTLDAVDCLEGGLTVAGARLGLTDTKSSSLSSPVPSTVDGSLSRTLASDLRLRKSLLPLSVLFPPPCCSLESSFLFRERNLGRLLWLPVDELDVVDTERVDRCEMGRSGAGGRAWDARWEDKDEEGEMVDGPVAPGPAEPPTLSVGIRLKRE